MSSPHTVQGLVRLARLAAACLGLAGRGRGRGGGGVSTSVRVVIHRRHCHTKPPQADRVARGEPDDDGSAACPPFPPLTVVVGRGQQAVGGQQQAVHRVRARGGGRGQVGTAAGVGRGVAVLVVGHGQTAAQA